MAHVGSVVRRTASNQTIAMLVALAIVVAAAVVGSSAVLEGPEGFTRAQLAESERLTALAESIAFKDALRRRELDSARWDGAADHFRRERARQAEIDRLNGLADHLGIGNGLTRSQLAEADRLTGLAESLGLTAP